MLHHAATAGPVALSVIPILRRPIKNRKCVSHYVTYRRRSSLFFPLPLGISCVTPFHIILCRRLLYSLPHHPHLSRVPSTPAEWRNSLQQSTYRGGTWILSTCYILSLLVILLLASIVQQLCSFRGVQRCRLPTAGRISVPPPFVIPPWQYVSLKVSGFGLWG